MKLGVVVRVWGATCRPKNQSGAKQKGYLLDPLRMHTQLYIQLHMQLYILAL